MTTKRLAFLVDEETYNELSFIPNGIRAEVYRSLLRLLIETQRGNKNVYVADDLVNNRLELVKKDSVGEKGRVE